MNHKTDFHVWCVNKPEYSADLSASETYFLDTEE
jgi:hypothetical protein